MRQRRERTTNAWPPLLMWRRIQARARARGVVVDMAVPKRPTNEARLLCLLDINLRLTVATAFRAGLAGQWRRWCKRARLVRR